MAEGSLREQWLVHTINMIRLDPLAAAARYQIDLNAGLPPGTISGAQLQPIAYSDLLDATAAFHGAWLLDNDASGTTGLGGSSPGDRIAYAGYGSETPWQWAEIVGWRGFTAGITESALNLDTVIQMMVRDLMLNPNLRALLLAPEWSEIGASQVNGDGYSQNGQDWFASMLTIDLVGNPGQRFITGNVRSSFVTEPFTFVVSSVLGANVVGTDGSDQAGLGGGYSILATSDNQRLQIGNALISLTMPEGNVKVDLINNVLVEASTTFTLRSAGFNARLSGTLDTDLSAAEAAGNTWLIGNAGSNRVIGNSHNNTLDGGRGLDRLIGKGGNDLYHVHGQGVDYDDASNDAVIESVGGGNDTVVVRYSYVLTAGSEVELIKTQVSIFRDAINLTGNKLSQRLEGNHGDNRLDGGGGGDTLYGNLGNDLYYVRNAADQIVEYSGEGTDTVRSYVSFALASDDSIETLITNSTVGTVAIDLTGNDFSQVIRGNAASNTLMGLGGADLLDGKAGNDKLHGGEGNDKLYGGAGADLLTGGAGADNFYFTTAPGLADADTITDFVAAQDRIYLERDFYGLTGSRVASAQFKDLSLGSLDADDRIVFDRALGNLYFDADGSGGQDAQLFAHLSNGAVVTYADLWLV
jgi:Ca2+-binding RTX toxin-like protein